MKRKTSITLSGDVLDEVDRLSGSRESRSGFIERALREHLRRREQEAADQKDLRRLNGAADRLNAEAADVLDYQSPAAD